MTATPPLTLLLTLLGGACVGLAIVLGFYFATFRTVKKEQRLRLLLALLALMTTILVAGTTGGSWPTPTSLPSLLFGSGPSG